MKKHLIQKGVRQKICKYKNYYTVFLGVIFLIAVFIVTYALAQVNTVEYHSGDADTTLVDKVPEVDARTVVTHISTPDAVRAIYMTSCVVGTPSFRTKLESLIEETELNSVVIDIKDYSGTISFPTQSLLLQGAWEKAQCGARDLESFIKNLHKKDIYVIGRITVFQDPYYTKKYPDLAVKKESDGSVWKDYKGLSFVDVGAKGYWDYIVELSKESYNIGFDELNFDYIRFPSDGNIKDIAFKHTKGGKAEQLEKFFSYLHTQLSDEKLFSEVKNKAVNKGRAVPILSADLFGMTTTNTDDLNIGQVLERALPYFDYISPMVYPSHYPKGFNGWKNPNNYPYGVVHFSMQTAVKRVVSTTTLVKTIKGELVSTSTSPYTYSKKSYSPLVLRPWLQDFDYGGDYDIPEVKAQIRAVYDSGLTSWMLWAPSNIYTRGALKITEE